MEENKEKNKVTEELSYEEEQLQQILIKEIEQYKLKAERELKEKQDLEYQESLKKDMTKELIFEEISLEEMRRVRLARFSN